MTQALRKEDKAWPMDRLRRLASAWNNGVILVDLTARFGVNKGTIQDRLKQAEALGLQIRKRDLIKERSW